jgi:opacity protein-like surface antigen
LRTALPGIFQVIPDAVPYNGNYTWGLPVNTIMNMRPAITKSLLLLLLGVGAAMCQPFSAGVKLGVPLTDFFSTVENSNFTFNATTDRYIISPTAELHLPLGFAIEVDALYRHMSYTGTGVVGSITGSSVNSGDWEFPLLLKYRFPMKIARPYVDGGVAWDKLFGLTDSVKDSIAGQSPAVTVKNTTTGIVFGGGVDIHIVKIHLMPELRYTRWGSAQFTDPTMLLSSTKNQAEFLLGITF